MFSEAKGCSIYRWRKHTATTSNPKGAVMAVGGGGRPAGKEELTTHESHNVLKIPHDLQSEGVSVPRGAATIQGRRGNVARSSRSRSSLRRTSAISSNVIEEF